MNDKLAEVKRLIAEMESARDWLASVGDGPTEVRVRRFSEAKEALSNAAIAYCCLLLAADGGMVERIARELCKIEGGDPDGFLEYECGEDENPFEPHPELRCLDKDGNPIPQWRSYERHANTAIAYCRELKEPTS